MMPLSAAGIWIEPLRMRLVPARVLVAIEFDAERVAERCHGAAEKDGAARAADFYDFQFILCGEGADLFDVGGARAVAGGELRAGEMLAPRGREFADFCDVWKLFGRAAAAEEDGYLDLFLWVAWSDFARAGKQSAFAAGQVYAFFNLWHDFLQSI